MRVGLGKKRGTHMEGGTDGQGDSRSGFFHDKRKRPGAKCFHMLKVIIFSLHIFPMLRLNCSFLGEIFE